MKRKIEIVCSVIIAALVLLALHTRGHVLRANWLSYLLWLVPFAIAYELLRRFWLEPPDGRANIVATVPLFVLLGGLILHLYSSGVDHNWFFFLCWKPNVMKEVDWGCDMIRLVVLIAILWPLFLFRRLKMNVILWVILIFAQVCALMTFFIDTHGAPLYRYDHPSFMFRLHEFAGTYPQLINYVPHWNGGSVGYITSVSGTTGIGAILWPFWKLIPIHLMYTYALAFLFIIVIPWVAVLSLRYMGAKWSAGACAGILSMGVSLHFFLWLLNYGTIGSSFALCFIVPFSACLYRVAWLGKTDKWTGLALVLSAFFLIQWPPGVIMASPFIISFLISYRKWTKQKWIFLAVCGGIVFLLYARTIWLFMSFGSGHMDEVLAAESETSSRFVVTMDALASGLDHIRAHLREGNPIITFLGLAGAFCLPYRSLRRWYVPLIIVLGLAAGWGQEFFPRLQISRMAVPLLFAGVVPAGIAASRILECRRRRASLAQAALVSILLLSGWNVARIYGNENPRTHYVTISPRVENIVHWIKEHTPEDARVLFAGPAIHVYGGGQVAYMALLADREMFACDYYSFPPDTTDYRMPPREFESNEADRFEYMQMFNVTHILTHHEKWKRRLRKDPIYTEVARWREISMFTVGRKSSGMFYKGSGKVEADFNRLSIMLPEAQSDVVLCYNWIEGFDVSDPVEIYPYESLHGVRLLGIRPNGEKQITLRYKRWF